MIHGYITPEGVLTLTSGNPTELWALKHWLAETPDLELIVKVERAIDEFHS
jgi:hypothetical protein